MIGQDKAKSLEETAVLDMLAALVSPEVDQADTPETFLTALSETLKASDETDVELAGILSDHLLTVAPHTDAVAIATAAIAAIAAKRAASVQERNGG